MAGSTAQQRTQNKKCTFIKIQFLLRLYALFDRNATSAFNIAIIVHFFFFCVFFFSSTHNFSVRRATKRNNNNNCERDCERHTRISVQMKRKNIFSVGIRYSGPQSCSQEENNNNNLSVVAHSQLTKPKQKCARNNGYSTKKSLRDPK